MPASELSPCERLRNLVTEYLEDVMAGEELVWFESHVERCHSCDTHLEQVKSFIATLGRIGPDPVSDETRSRLHVAFQRWRTELSE